MACANQTTGSATGLTNWPNGRAANWAPEVAFSPFRARFPLSTDVPILLLNQPNTNIEYDPCETFIMVWNDWLIHLDSDVSATSCCSMSDKVDWFTVYEEKLSQERGLLSQPSQLLRALTPLPESTVPPPRGGGVLPYIFLIGICRLKGYGFCAVLVWNGGVDFACFGLNSGMVFDGSAWTCLSLQFQMDKKERVICEFETEF